jgi:hypothetical protein
MKNQIKTFVRNLGGQVRYSGKQKTMYISEAHHEPVLKAFGLGLPFKLGIL